MAVGGIIGVILDNLVPGTPEERGLLKWQRCSESEMSGKESGLDVYDLPFGIGNNWKISKYLPFLPYYPNDGKSQQISLH